MITRDAIDGPGTGSAPAESESERGLRSVLEGATAGLILADPAGRLLWSNRAFAEMVGYAPSELAGTRIEELVHDDERAAIADDLERLRLGLEHRLAAEKRYVRNDGGIVVGRTGLTAARADDGSLLHVVGQVEDATELRRVQAELDESQALHRLVFESSRDVLSVFGTDGSIHLVSPSVRRVLGYEPGDVVGMDYSSFIHPDDLTATASAVQEAIRGEQPSPFRARFLAADGTYRLWEGTVSPGLGPDGEVRFLVANSRDVTAQVALEEQLRHAQKMEAVGRLAGGVAHDFNNLLLAIRGFAELALHKAELREDGSAEIGEVIAAAERAAGLTSQLLAFSRRQVMNTEVLDLSEVVADVVSMLRRLISGNVELVTLSPDEPTPIVADRAQIEQVVANLAVNARDAMPEGGRLSLTVEKVPAENCVRLIVGDTGTVMDAETATQIFEPFFTTKGAEGTGLGLSMVHGIVSQSGGEIVVDSTPGEGTTFTISLPLADGVDDVQEQTAVAAASGGGETILLVEDDATVKAVVGKMLEGRGYRLIEAATGEEAVKLAESAPGRIDLLLTDLVMPGINGRKTAEAVLVSQPRAKVLYMSGYTDDGVIRVGGFEPGVAFIQKPFGAEELAVRVRGLLDSSG